MNLTDTQLVVLCAACRRDDGMILPLPENLRGGAAKKVGASLIRKGLAEEVEARPLRGDPIWRETGDGHGVTLIATTAAYEAVGMERNEPKPASAPEPAQEPQSEPAAQDDASEDETPPSGADTRPTPTPRSGTKQATMIALMERPEGATNGEIAEATGWQPHTIRGAIAGALKKRLGLDVRSEKIEGRGTVYSIKRED